MATFSVFCYNTGSYDSAISAIEKYGAYFIGEFDVPVLDNVRLNDGISEVVDMINVSQNAHGVFGHDEETRYFICAGSNVPENPLFEELDMVCVANVNDSAFHWGDCNADNEIRVNETEFQVIIEATAQARKTFTVKGKTEMDANFKALEEARLYPFTDFTVSGYDVRS